MLHELCRVGSKHHEWNEPSFLAADPLLKQAAVRLQMLHRLIFVDQC